MVERNKNPQFMLSLISMAIKKIRKDSFRKIQSASEQKNKAEFFSQKICQVFSAFDKKKKHMVRLEENQ